MKSQKILLIAFLSLITLASCSDDDNNPLPVNEEEVITTLEVTLTNGTTTVTLLSTDLDGDGPNDPVVSVSGNFEKGMTYDGVLKLLNETESPAENITEEVEEEALDHQFFYSTTNSIATFAYSDEDTDGNPIGIEFKMTASADAGNGKVTFTLRHEPNKNASGVKDGDITNAAGETDIEVTFDVVVE
ncbi:hypothetical protein C7447_102467 [Tenacibaculum adriaticum]|uniref:Type 1 periplasmic binding fold superfamily protein n=1 Tax=Tenacibaculum adriaticum TaxID=413713 RepID=A0A5S5DV52_9FLAO|nr:type 1 periplasmic binding fold superfamily protein [Tenacibaculum adriaticum]TYP99148.1 hypothetical protein C7447_102467 [Tenacibaculum adriaticum]